MRLGQIPGLNESRLYRAEDGSRAIVVAGFDSVETFKQFQHGAAFQAERARLQPFLEGAQPAFYRLIDERPPGAGYRRTFAADSILCRALLTLNHKASLSRIGLRRKGRTIRQAGILRRPKREAL